jgi:hypothetical protein
LVIPQARGAPAGRRGCHHLPQGLEAIDDPDERATVHRQRTEEQILLNTLATLPPVAPRARPQAEDRTLLSSVLVAPANDIASRTIGTAGARLMPES